MKFSMLAIIGVLFSLVVMQPSVWSFQGTQNGQPLTCDIHTGAVVLAETTLAAIDKPLTEWIGEGNRISVVALDAEQTTISIISSKKSSWQTRSTCATVNGGASTLL